MTGGITFFWGGVLYHFACVVLPTTVNLLMSYSSRFLICSPWHNQGGSMKLNLVVCPVGHIILKKDEIENGYIVYINSI